MEKAVSNVCYYDGTEPADKDIEETSDGGVPGRCLLDVYRPTRKKKDKEKEAYPVVVFVHGGSWRGGDKAAPMYCGQVWNLAEKGFVVVSVEYRKTRMPGYVFFLVYPLYVASILGTPFGLILLGCWLADLVPWWSILVAWFVPALLYWVYWGFKPAGGGNFYSQAAPGPAVRWEVMAQDLSRALRWVKDKAPLYGGDPKRIALVGHSAGAHLASMVCAEPNFLRRVGMNPADISLLVGVSGVYDLHMLRKSLLKPLWWLVKLQSLTWAFGASSQWESASVVKKVRDWRSDKVFPARCLLFCGGSESLSFHEMMDALHAALSDAGVKVEKNVLPDQGHQATASQIGCGGRDAVSDAIAHEFA
eukprot:Hpha_TRINITY_DN9692_c0_g1::TRINITY_DN9692_c0_g1_i1::g.184254::m.184254